MHDHDHDPSDPTTDTPAPIGVGRADYHDRREARAARLDAAADKAAAESAAAYSGARQLASMIPFGQPILVGHHSERRARRDHERIHAGMRKSIDRDRDAKALRQRANAAESNTAISSDDPDAIERLQGKLADLESERERMRETGRAAKRGDPAAQLQIAREARHWPGGVDPAKGWPRGYSSCISANIRATKQRIEHLQAQAQRIARSESFGRWSCAEDPDTNRTRMETADGSRATPDERRALKSRGFRWAPSVGAWQRQISNGAWYAATEIARQFSGGGQ